MTGGLRTALRVALAVAMAAWVSRCAAGQWLEATGKRYELYYSGRRDAAAPLRPAPGRLADRRLVPETFLDCLPKYRHVLLLEAHRYWDTGKPHRMVLGSEILSGQLRALLCDILATGYPSAYFGGKSARQHYNAVCAGIRARYGIRKDRAGATRQTALDASRMACAMDDAIASAVRELSNARFYRKWRAKWDRALQIGLDGKMADVEGPDRL